MALDGTPGSGGTSSSSDSEGTEDDDASTSTQTSRGGNLRAPTSGTDGDGTEDMDDLDDVGGSGEELDAPPSGDTSTDTDSGGDGGGGAAPGTPGEGGEVDAPEQDDDSGGGDFGGGDQQSTPDTGGEADAPGVGQDADSDTDTGTQPGDDTEDTGGGDDTVTPDDTQSSPGGESVAGGSASIPNPIEDVNFVGEDTTQGVTSRIEAETGLEAGRDFTVSRGDDVFAIEYTDEYFERQYAQDYDQRYQGIDIDVDDVDVVRESDASGEAVVRPELAAGTQQAIAADQLDKEYSQISITREDVTGIEETEGGGMQPVLSQEAEDRILESQAASDLGVSLTDVEVEQGQVRAETTRGAEALAEAQVTQQTGELENVETEVLAPGIVRASGDPAGGEVAAPGQESTVVASTGGQELLGELERFDDVQENLSAQAASERAIEASEDARQQATEQAIEDVEEATGADLEASDVNAYTTVGDAGESVVRAELTESGQETLRQDAEADALDALSEQTGADLDQDDVEFTRTTQDGQAVFEVSLTDAGEKSVAAANAPGKGVPVLEDVFEGGAIAQTEYEQATEPVVETFNEITPDTSGVEETFNDYTPDVRRVIRENAPGADDLKSFAAVGAPIAVAEPSPAGEVVIGGALVGAAALTAASARSASSPARTTEVDVPSAGVFANEIEVTGAQQAFPDELSVPTGVTTSVQRGELRIGELYPDELEATEQSADEIQVTDDEGESITGGDEFPTPETEGAVDAPASGGVGLPTPSGPESPIGPMGPTLPGGQGTGIGTPAGGIAGRELPGEEVGEDALTRFFDVDLTDPFTESEFLEAAEQPEVGGDAATGPAVSPGVDAGVDAGSGGGNEMTTQFDDLGEFDTGAESPSFSESVPQSTAVTDAPSVFSSPTTTQGAFGFEQGQEYQFEEPNRFEYEYTYEFPFTQTTRPTLPRGLPDDNTARGGDSPDGDSRRFSRLFENPTISPEEAVDFSFDTDDGDSTGDGRDAVADDLDSLF